MKERRKKGSIRELLEFSVVRHSATQKQGDQHSAGAGVFSTISQTETGSCSTYYFWYPLKKEHSGSL